MVTSRTCLAIVTVGLILVYLPVHGQVSSQDLHDQSRWRGAGMPSQHPLGASGMDTSSAYLQRRDDEERERREMHERQRRMVENFANIPDQLREPYPRRSNPPATFR